MRLVELRPEIRVIHERGTVVRDIVEERLRGAATRRVGQSVLVEDAGGAVEASAREVEVARGRA